jgi:hypothetical protein
MANNIKQENILQTSCGCHIHLLGLVFKGKTQLVSGSTIKIEGKQLWAHRVAWQNAHGPIPEGKLVLHKCDVGCCINPEHLYLGDYKDNARDRVQRGRSAQVSDSFRFSMKGKRQTTEHTEKIRATLWGNIRGAKKI